MSEKEHTIVIEEDGRARFIYSDDLVDLTKQGLTRITRASHVEPASDYCPQCRGRINPGPCRCFALHAIWVAGWVADMTPSGGPVLLAEDGHPFKTREAALDAERAWLREHRGL